MGAPAASLGMLDRDYRGRMWRHRAAGFFREGLERGGSFSGTKRSRCTPFNPPPLLQCTVCAAILKKKLRFDRSLGWTISMPHHQHRAFGVAYHMAGVGAEKISAHGRA